MTRLLLVEDDAQIVQSLRDFLREEGYEVRAVGDKRSALAMLEQERFDLALLDVSLPDGSGLDVCRAIKDTPVVFLTASDDENSVVAGLDLGADDYIIKPFRPRELASRLRSVLRRSGGSEYLLRPGLVCKGLPGG
ncbi:MAG: response regulator transcription factor, partial [Oscillospiraceae bacterium]|nr:response regulator transcription factor [Oscillospiraceae bacterium]